jgi:hypothetical protein
MRRLEDSTSDSRLVLLALLLPLAAGGCQKNNASSHSVEPAETPSADNATPDPGNIVDPGDPESPPPDPGCADDPNLPPATPQILSPAASVVGVIPEELVLRSSAFQDADGNAHASSEFEIWRASGGRLTSRVWYAALAGARLETRLAEGVFTSAAAGAGLAPWTDYAVRVRYRDDASCPRASDWSPAVAFRTDDGSAYLFDPTQVRSFYLDIPPESWLAINAEAVPSGCVPIERSHYSGSLTFEGLKLEGIGVHAKGGCGSARDLSGKAAFNLNLSWDDPAVPGCPAERRLYGEKHFTFNNMVQDPSMAHETLGYAYYRALGLPTPRVSHVRLYVNDQYWGVYLLLESFDRRFLARRFADNRGMAYQGSYFCDLIPANLPTGAGASCFSPEFDVSACDTVQPGDDPTDFSLLRQLVAQIEALPPGGFYPAVESFFSFDTFLTQWAADSVLSHWDGCEFWTLTNYRIYHDPLSDKWTLIQTGLDQALRDDVDPFNVGAVLARRCLKEPACEAAFVAHLRAALTVFETMDLEAEAQRLHSRILPDVLADPRKGYGEATFVQAHADLLAWIHARPALVRQHLLDREVCGANNGGCGDRTFNRCTASAERHPVCADIDECATNNGGCGDPLFIRCTNNHGAAPSCVDIDECAKDNGGCGDSLVFRCTNNLGAAPSCSPIVCTLVPQSGCPAGSACDLDPAASAGSSTRCRVAGSGTERTLCTQGSGCAAGSHCAAGACIRFCRSDTDCAGPGGLCVHALLDGSGLPVPGPIFTCSQNCDPVTAVGCPPGWACGIYREPAPGIRNLTTCHVAGSGLTGQTCGGDTDCAVGGRCVSGPDGRVCLQTCAVGAGTCAVETCHGMDMPQILGGTEFGVCRP